MKALTNIGSRIKLILGKAKIEQGDMATGSKWLLIFAGLFVVLQLALGFYWSREPDLLAIAKPVATNENINAGKNIAGYVTTDALIQTARLLLIKPGGYLTNDLLPPGSLVDNIPNWEFGVLVQVRDLARALRNDMSRSQTQSTEDSDLAAAEPLFNFDNDSWMLPPSENEYAKGIEALTRYRNRLMDTGEISSQFFTRADNLRDWLAVVEKRLGSLSQRLSASVGQVRINTDLAGDSAAGQSTPKSKEVTVKTPWLEVDDVFYESRGSTWALVHFLRAIEIDFSDVLAKKNALVSLQQIIRELEATQNTVWSPVVLNGDGFGFVTNYSLIMASYISRANAAVIDLRNLLLQG